MISYKKDGMKYNYRAGVIIINNKDEVLIQNKEKYSFWILPGGRIEFLETSEETIKRELKEELNLQIAPERVVLISEIINKKEKYHENLVFYLLHIEKNKITKENYINCLDDKDVKFKWVKIEDLDDINLYPHFLKEIIKNIPDTIQYYSQKIDM